MHAQLHMGRESGLPRESILNGLLRFSELSAVQSGMDSIIRSSGRIIMDLLEADDIYFYERTEGNLKIRHVGEQSTTLANNPRLVESVRKTMLTFAPSEVKISDLYPKENRLLGIILLIPFKDPSGNIMVCGIMYARTITHEDNYRQYSAQAFLAWMSVLLENKRLDSVSMTDQLTGIWNRRYYQDSINSLVASGLRHGHIFSLILFDIDHFKTINDTYGHSAGDHVLSSIGRLTRKNLRRSDIPCRIGGEEFALLLPDTGLVNAARLAEKLRRIIEKTEFVIEGKRMPVTASFGVACFATDSGRNNPGEYLFQQADNALYRAKSTGRNRTETAKEENMYAALSTIQGVC